VTDTDRVRAELCDMGIAIEARHLGDPTYPNALTRLANLLAVLRSTRNPTTKEQLS
jgi:hypothetical protein